MQKDKNRFDKQMAKRIKIIKLSQTYPKWVIAGNELAGNLISLQC